METVTIKDLPFADEMTPEAMTEVHGGRLAVRKAGEKPLEYLTIQLSDVIISGVSTGSSD